MTKEKYKISQARFAWAKTTLNYLVSFVTSSPVYAEREFADVFSPEAVEEIHENYRIDVPAPETYQALADEFKKLSKSSISLDGNWHHDKFMSALEEGSEDANAIEAKLIEIFKPKDNKLQQMVQDFDAMAKLVKDPATTLPVTALAAYASEIDRVAQAELNRHLEAKIKGIQEAFKDQDFRDQLKKVLELKSEKAVTQAEQSMIEQVRQKHQAALDAYQKQSAEQLKQIQSAAQAAQKNLMLLAVIYANGNQQMRDQIDGLCESPITAITHGSAKKNFGDLNINTLSSISAFYGSTIESDPSGRVTVNMPGWFSPSYYFNPGKYLDAEYLVAALKVASANPKPDKIEVKFTPPDGGDMASRLSMARAAYRACRRAGWPEDKIKIDIRDKEGKEMTIDQLFRGHEQSKKLIEVEAHDWMRQTEEQLKSQLSQGKIKTALSKQKVAPVQELGPEPEPEGDSLDLS